MALFGRLSFAPASSVVDRAIRVVLVASVLANLVYLVALLLPGDPAAELVDVGMSDVAEGLPVALVWLAAVRARPWAPEVTLAALALTCNFAADLYYGAAMDADGYLASPSLADLGYLAYYPILSAAFVVTVLRWSRRATGAVLIDVGLAFLGSASILALILSPSLPAPGSGSGALNDLIAILYPLFDVILVALVAGVAASPELRAGPRAPLLVAGLLLFTGADVVYALQNHAGTYSAGTPLDAGWTVGVLLVAFWAVTTRRDPRIGDMPGRSRRLLPIPAAAVVAGLVVLLVATQVRVPAPALVLAAATIALAAIPVLLRQADLARSLADRQRTVDHLLAVDKARDDMIATVNHEMRTPLTSLLGYLELVLDEEGGPLPPAARQMLGVAHDGASRLSVLVSDLMASTRLETGARTAGAPVRLDDVLRELIDRARPVAGARGVDIRLDVREPVTVDGDRERLMRALGQIIDNAVKFSVGPGSVCIGVELRAGATARAVEISVVDGGIGIPAGDLSSVFDRFFRAANARGAAIPGSGLGLGIARSSLEADAGSIAIESVEGSGTTVRVVLPVASDRPRGSGGEGR